MAIDAIENNTLVKGLDGHKGRVQVTRRERKLIDAGKMLKVTVRGTDGLNRSMRLEDITVVITNDTSVIEGS